MTTQSICGSSSSNKVTSYARKAVKFIMSSTSEDADATPAEIEANDNDERNQTVIEGEGSGQEAPIVAGNDLSKSEQGAPKEESEPKHEPELENKDIGLPGDWRIGRVRKLETSDRYGSYLEVTEEEPSRPFEYVLLFCQNPFHLRGKLTVVALS